MHLTTGFYYFYRHMTVKHFYEIFFYSKNIMNYQFCYPDNAKL